MTKGVRGVQPKHISGFPQQPQKVTRTVILALLDPFIVTPFIVSINLFFWIYIIWVIRNRIIWFHIIPFAISGSWTLCTIIHFWQTPTSGGPGSTNIKQNNARPNSSVPNPEFNNQGRFIAAMKLSVIHNKGPKSANISFRATLFFVTAGEIHSHVKI